MANIFFRCWQHSPKLCLSPEVCTAKVFHEENSNWAEVIFFGIETWVKNEITVSSWYVMFIWLMSPEHKWWICGLLSVHKLKLVTLHDSDVSHPLRSTRPLAMPVQQSPTQIQTHNFIGHLQTNCDTIDKSASRSESGVQKAHSPIAQKPTLHADLPHDARWACQNHSLLSNVLTFLSCWEAFRAGRGV